MAKMTKRQQKLNEIDEAKKLEKKLQDEFETMVKKQNDKKEEARQLAKKLQDEFEDIVKKQEEEREEARKQIDTIAVEHNLYCGVILTEEDILNLLKVKFANSGENIRIKYNLYIEEKKEI